MVDYILMHKIETAIIIWFIFYPFVFVKIFKWFQERNSINVSDLLVITLLSLTGPLYTFAWLCNAVVEWMDKTIVWRKQ